jgi:hypothetical protein
VHAGAESLMASLDATVFTFLEGHALPLSLLPTGKNVDIPNTKPTDTQMPPKQNKVGLKPQPKVALPSSETVKIYRILETKGSPGLLKYIDAKKATAFSMACHLFTLYEFGILDLGKLLGICLLTDGECPLNVYFTELLHIYLCRFANILESV